MTDSPKRQMRIAVSGGTAETLLTLADEMGMDPTEFVRHTIEVLFGHRASKSGHSARDIKAVVHDPSINVGDLVFINDGDAEIGKVVNVRHSEIGLPVLDVTTWWSEAPWGTAYDDEDVLTFDAGSLVRLSDGDAVRWENRDQDNDGLVAELRDQYNVHPA